MAQNEKVRPNSPSDAVEGDRRSIDEALGNPSNQSQDNKKQPAADTRDAGKYGVS